MRFLRLKLILLVFSIFQVLWTLFAAYPNDSLYPIYSWKIFHVWPNKYGTFYFAYIHRLNGEKFDPPIDFYDIKDRFPSTDPYSLSKKLETLGGEFDKPEAGHLRGLVDETLTRDFQDVEWEFVKIHFEYISYYLERKFIEKQSLGKYEAHAAPN